MKSVLITGGAGFIGSNFIPYFAQKYPDYRIINLDKLTYAGNLDNLAECESFKNYLFVKGDICDEALIDSLFTKFDIRGVIHFAAESHVDNSIKGPKSFMETNYMGTFNLIENARAHWMTAPNQFKPAMRLAAFIIFLLMRYMALWVKPAISLKRRHMRLIVHTRPARRAQTLLCVLIIILMV